KPVIYQNVKGKRRVVAGRYVKMGARQISFRVAAYNRSLPLVIDPSLSYTAFLSGGGVDAGHGIAVDAGGNAYVTGRTSSTDFPITTGAFQTSFANGSCTDGLRSVPCTDVFVTKLNATGTALIYSTYFGGAGFDEASDIAVDAAGNAYITGR